MADAGRGQITIVGLGPAGGEWLTRQAWEVLAAADVVHLRTARHPAVSDLPAHLRRVSFDHIYDTADDFAAVYEQIVAEVLRLGRTPAGVVYAVPGHPHIGEATVPAIIAAAQAEGLPVTVVPGLSFVEPTLGAIGVDGLDGLQLFDAIEAAGYNHPPVNPDTPLLLGQLYNRLLANELKLALMSIYPEAHDVVLVHAAGTAREVVETVPLYAIDRSERIDHLTSLYVPPLPTPAGLPALAEMAAVLRGPGGCPWDQEQTPQSLRAGFLEEVSEVLEALDARDPAGVREELGDVLLHVVMQAQMATEAEQFRLSEVVAGIYAKIKRRHPHVWGDWDVAGSDEVVANWEAIKAEEKGSSEPHSLLDGVPATLPALARAQQVQDRVRKVGFDWPDVNGVTAKLEEEVAELKAAASPAGEMAELGDILFVVANWASWLGLDAEAALREATLRFGRRFRLLETLATERGLMLAEMDVQGLDALWEEAKALLADETAADAVETET